MEAVARFMEVALANSKALKCISQENYQNRNETKWKSSSYKCDKCKDTGWLLIPQPNSADLAISCDCRELEKVKNQWIAAGINPEQGNQTFSNFLIWNKTSQKARDAAGSYYKSFETIHKNRNNSILFCGQVGSGKTHLSVALALNFMKNKIKVVYMPYRDVIIKIKLNMLDTEYYNKQISKYQSCELLLIDDLFKGKINDTDINIVFEILNYRYQNSLPIIVSTEFTVEQLLEFDEAIGSRIYEMCKDYIVEIGKGKENNYRLR